jgi:hypothetical protein
MTITRMVKDFVLSRRQPEKYSMETCCPILNVLSESFDFTLHGPSTMILFHCFSNDLLRRSLGIKEYKLLTSFVETGSPVVRSINDGQQHKEDALFVFPKGVSRPQTPTKVQIPKKRSIIAQEVKTPEKTASNSEPVYTILEEKSERGKTKRCDWSLEDDWKLVRGFELHEGRWRAMARHLQLGSDDRLRNRWFRLVEGTQGAQREVVEEARRLAKNVESDSPPKKQRKTTIKFQGRTYTTACTSSSGSEQGDDTDRRKWTTEEDEEIIRVISNPDLWTEKIPSVKLKAPWFFLSSKIKGRTKQAIRNRAHRLVMRNSTRGHLRWKDLQSP